jgi:DNA-binding IclR family transcriptional regulator
LSRPAEGTPAQALEPVGRGVLDGAFRLLRALPEADRDHQLADLARLTGIPRASVYRLMAQLHAVGAVERPCGHYVIAQSLADITRRAEPVTGLRAHAVDVMRTLRRHTGATISLVVPSEQGCTALEVLPGRQALPTPIHPGIAMPDGAAAALVLNPHRAPEHVGPGASWANDNARVHAGLTCFASAIRVDGRTEAVLQISTPASSPARRFAGLLHDAANWLAAQL